MQQLTGIVIKTLMPKTAKVQVTRRWTHPLYHKTITKRKSYQVHCEIAVKAGDKVIMRPIRPMSKMKKWKIIKKI